jgi:hypothetical protein
LIAKINVVADQTHKKHVLFICRIYSYWKPLHHVFSDSLLQLFGFEVFDWYQPFGNLSHILALFFHPLNFGFGVFVLLLLDFYLIQLHFNFRTPHKIPLQHKVRFLFISLSFVLLQLVYLLQFLLLLHLRLVVVF